MCYFRKTNFNTISFKTEVCAVGIAVKKSRKRENKNSAEVAGRIGQFEVHTKGVGRKILEQQGWSEGQGLGSTIRGRPDAIDSEGQLPRDKRGIGY